jgi:Tfp pilus assembly protein PilN
MYQQINLYQPIFRKQRQIFSAMTMVQALGLVAVALLGVYGYGLWNVANLELEVGQLEGREQALTTQLGRIDPNLTTGRRQEIEQELQRLNTTLAGQQRLIRVLREKPIGSTGGFSPYLAALGRRRVAELWLTQFAINGGSGAIELAGRSTRAELVAEYLQRLGSEPVLVGQQFDQFEIERDDENGEAQFRATSRAVALTLADNDERRRR